MGTYGQLIRALDMDHRVEEAHKFWEMKIGSDLHSVPWQLCHVMISVYYRNNMLEDLVKVRFHYLRHFLCFQLVICHSYNFPICFFAWLCDTSEHSSVEMELEIWIFDRFHSNVVD